MASVMTLTTSAIWDFSQNFFPAKSFGAFATGRPVVVRDNSLTREYLTVGAHFLPDFKVDSITKMRDEIENSYGSVDRKVPTPNA